MRRTLASPSLAMAANMPAAICGEVLSASIRTARRWVGAFAIGGVLVQDVWLRRPSLRRPGNIGQLARRRRQDKERPVVPGRAAEWLGCGWMRADGAPLAQLDRATAF